MKPMTIADASFILLKQQKTHPEDRNLFVDDLERIAHMFPDHSIYIRFSETIPEFGLVFLELTQVKKEQTKTALLELLIFEKHHPIQYVSGVRPDPAICNMLDQWKDAIIPVKQEGDLIRIGF